MSNKPKKWKSIGQAEPIRNRAYTISTPEAPQHKAQFMSRQGCLIIVALLAASYLLIYFLVL